MKIYKLRAQCGEIFDYQTLLSALKNYAYPRDKISGLLRENEIVRVKKGLYVFGQAGGTRRYSHEILANLIYGPSYVSLDYALYIYGLIPERVETITSVTLGRSKSFATPVGNFSYRKIGSKAYKTGMEQAFDETGCAYLIASPEKALVDKLQSERGLAIRSQKALTRYLSDNLRIEMSSVVKMDDSKISKYGVSYNSGKTAILVKLIQRLRKETAGNCI